MKKPLQCLLVSALFVVTPFIGCKRTSNAPVIPDVSNFSATALSPYTVGTTGSISVTSSSLASGNYTLKYHLTRFDINDITYQSAALAMSNHTGSFQTPVLTGTPGTLVTIDSIFNSIGNGIALTTGNLATLTDSTGLMTATIGAQPYNAVSVYAEINGATLSIGSEYYLSGSVPGTELFFAIQNYVATGTYSFMNDFWDGDAALITYPGNNVANMVTDTARYGTITITATSPLLKGSFSLTCLDSTKIAGTFMCPAP